MTCGSTECDMLWCCLWDEWPHTR